MKLSYPFAIIFIFVLCSKKWVDAQGHFVKDQLTDHHGFPPDLSFMPKGIPMGHLRPLGYHRISEGKLRGFNKDAPFNVFSQRCSSKNQACINLKGYHPNATALWGDKYLASNYGDIPVDVEIKYDYNSKFTRNRTSLIEFLKRYHYDEWSLKSFMPKEMIKDLTLPDIFHCPDLKDRILGLQLWMSSGPSNSPLFYEDKDTYNCLLTGRADVIAIKPENDKTVFNMTKGEYTKIYAGYSNINTEKINMFEHPKIQQMSWKWGIVKQSDCIFIPAGSMQQVSTYGRFMSVVFLFSTLRHYNCDLMVPSETLPLNLNQVDILWQFVNGTRVVNERFWTKEVLKRWIKAHTKPNGPMPIQDIVSLYKAVVIAPNKKEWNLLQEQAEMSKVRQNLSGKDRKEFLYLDDLDKWSNAHWTWIVDAFNEGGLQKAIEKRRRKDEL